MKWEIVANTLQSIIAALGIEARFKVPYWDALIPQAAGNCGSAVLYTDDLSHGQRYGAVEVVDPLRWSESRQLRRLSAVDSAGTNSSVARAERVEDSVSLG